jgi:hypothetical protein
MMLGQNQNLNHCDDLPELILNASPFDNHLLKIKICNQIGFRLIFPNQSQCIVWTDGNTYHSQVEYFGTIKIVRLEQADGDYLYEKFMDHCNKEFIIEYV